MENFWDFPDFPEAPYQTFPLGQNSIVADSTVWSWVSSLTSSPNVPLSAALTSTACFFPLTSGFVSTKNEF